MVLTIHAFNRARQRIKEFEKEDFYTIQEVLNLAIKSAQLIHHPNNDRFVGYSTGKYLICCDRNGHIVSIYFRNLGDYIRWKDELK